MQLLFYILDGYIISRTLLPIACGGRFFANFALTEPALPWVRVTFPQMTRNWDFSPFGLFGTLVLFLAWNKTKRFVLDKHIKYTIYCCFLIEWIDQKISIVLHSIFFSTWQDQYSVPNLEYAIHNQPVTFYDL